MAQTLKHLDHYGIDGQAVVYEHLQSQGFFAHGGCRQIDMMVDYNDDYFCIEFKFLSLADDRYRITASQILFSKKLYKKVDIPTILMVQDMDTKEIFYMWADKVNSSTGGNSLYLDFEGKKYYSIEVNSFQIAKNISLPDFIKIRFPERYLEAEKYIPDDLLGL